MNYHLKKIYAVPDVQTQFSTVGMLALYFIV